VTRADKEEEEAGGVEVQTAGHLAQAGPAASQSGPAALQPGPSETQRVDAPPESAISIVPVRVLSIRVGTTSIAEPGKMTLYGMTVQFGLAPNGEAYVRNLASGKGFELLGGRSVEGLQGTNWVPVVPGMQITSGEARIDCRLEGDTLVPVWLGPGDPLQRTTDAEAEETSATAVGLGVTQSADTLAFMRRRSTGGGLDRDHSVNRPGPPDRGSHAERRTYDRPSGGPSEHDGKPVYRRDHRSARQHDHGAAGHRRDERLPRSPDHGSYGGAHRRMDEGPSSPSRPAAHDRGGLVVRRTESPRPPATPDCRRRGSDTPIKLNIFGDIIVTNKPRELIVHFDSQGNTTRDATPLVLGFGINQQGEAYVVYKGNGEAYHSQSPMVPGRQYSLRPHPAHQPTRDDCITLVGAHFTVSFVWGKEYNTIVVTIHPRPNI